MFTLRFDMRAPATGAPAEALYSAAPEMCVMGTPGQDGLGASLNDLMSTKGT